MAPESERANVEKIPMDSVIECIVSQVHYLALKSVKGVVVPRTEPNDEQREHVRKILENSGWMTKPDEPTLTCSEVVERLMQEAVVRNGANSWLDRVAAEKILHSWRERRVQELEDALGRIRKSLEMSRMSSTTKFIAQFIDEAEAEVERLLKSDEWREQIRKGAKHE